MPITHARVAAAGVSLTPDMQYSVAIEYVDQADPNTVLHLQTFTLPLDTTTANVINRAKEYGRTVRAAQALLVSARVAVPAGAVTPID